METKISTSEVEQYKEILKANGITYPVSEVQIFTPESLKMDGGSSDAHYITVTFTDTSIKPLKLFVKKPNHERNAIIAGSNIFKKESQFFGDFIPAAKKFCKSKGHAKMLDIYPECYYADEEMLVFENLVEGKGYTFLKKQDRLGLDASRIALTSLAKHHAITFALIQEAGGPDNFFKTYPMLNFESYGSEGIIKFLGPMIQNGIKTNIKILEGSNAEGKEEAISILKAHFDKGFDLVWDELQYNREEEKILALNHGDYWCGNMAYMRDETTQELLPGIHKVVDFQVLRYNSPLIDVGNFMYTSMKPETRQDHREELLKTYLNELNSASKDLGHPIDLTYEELFAIFRKKFKYGFWFAIWLAVEADYAVISQVNATANESINYVKEFDRLVQKYIDERPENCERDAKILVGLMKEFSYLSQT